MFDLKKVDMKSLKSDLTKFAIMLVVARLIKFWVVDTQGRGGDVTIAFSQDFLYSSVFTLVGFAVFWLVIEPNMRDL